MKKERKSQINDDDKHLPAEYLRKAWFIILADVLRKPGIYIEHLPVALRPSFEELVPYLKDIIVERRIKNESFAANGTERAWYEYGVTLPNGEASRLNIPLAYRIERGGTPIICKAIALASGLSREDAQSLKIKDNSDLKSAVQQNIHFYLSAGAVTNNFFVFQYKTIKIGKTSAIKLIDYAISVLDRTKPKHRKEDGDLLNFMKQEIVRYAAEHRQPRMPKEIKEKAVASRHLRFWETKKGRYMLGRNAFWIQYERIDWPEGTKNFGLSASAIHFKVSGEGYLICTMYKLSHVNEAHFDKVTYTGLATIDEGNWLHADLQSTQDNTHPYLSRITVRLGNLAIQEILIGHHHFFAVSRHRYLCKTVVWKQYQLDENDLIDGVPDTKWVFNNFVKIIDPVAQKTGNEVIHPSIFQFLRNRQLNRLTMPREPIMMLDGQGKDALTNWLLLQQNPREEDIYLNACAGEYYVVYHHGQTLTDPKVTRNRISKLSDDQIITESRFDSLQIVKEQSRYQCTAVFIHNNSTTNVYRGDVTRKMRSVEILLEDQDSLDDKSGQRNLVLLTFSVPEEGNLKRFKSDLIKSPFLEGIISGLTDRGFKSIAFKALIIPKKQLLADTKGFSTQDLNPQIKALIISYFKNNAGNLAISAGLTMGLID